MRRTSTTLMMEANSKHVAERIGIDGTLSLLLSLSRRQVTLPRATTSQKTMSRQHPTVRTLESLMPTPCGDLAKTFCNFSRSPCPARSAGTRSSTMLCVQVFCLFEVGVPDLHSVLATRLVSRRRLEFVISKLYRFCSLQAVAQAIKYFQRAFKTVARARKRASLSLHTPECCLRTLSDSSSASLKVFDCRTVLYRKRQTLERAYFLFLQRLLKKDAVRGKVCLPDDESTW